MIRSCSLSSTYCACVQLYLFSPWPYLVALGTYSCLCELISLLELIRKSYIMLGTGPKLAPSKRIYYMPCCFSIYVSQVIHSEAGIFKFVLCIFILTNSSQIIHIHFTLQHFSHPCFFHVCVYIVHFILRQIKKMLF